MVEVQCGGGIKPLDGSINSNTGDWLKGIVSEVSNSTRSTDCAPAGPLSESDGVWCLSRGSTGRSEASEDKAICDLVACEISKGMVLEAHVSRDAYYLEFPHRTEATAAQGTTSTAGRPAPETQKPQCESRCSDYSEANLSIKGMRNCDTPSDVGGFMQDFARGLLTEETVNGICSSVSAQNSGGEKLLEQGDPGCSRPGASSRQSDCTATESVASYATPGGLAIIEEEDREVFRNVSEEEVLKLAAGLVPLLDNGQQSALPSSIVDLPGSRPTTGKMDGSRPVTGSTACPADLSGTMTTSYSHFSPLKDLGTIPDFVGNPQAMADLHALASTPSQENCSILSYSVLGDAPKDPEHQQRQALLLYSEISKELAQELLPAGLREGLRPDYVQDQGRGFNDQVGQNSIGVSRQQALAAALAKGEEAERVAQEVASDSAIFLAVEDK